MNPPALEISIDDQLLRFLRADGSEKTYPVSTATKGAGTRPGSHRTPTGRFHIGEKIGAGRPLHTRFVGREPVGEWDGRPCDDDLILSRILRLEGDEPENRNTRDRYIYLHGTNREDLLGTPASCGCVRLANADIAELFEQVEPGTPVVIHPPASPRENLAFLDCDSTLSTIEGIDELARHQGDDVFARVEALTHAAMNGEVPVEEVFGRRLELIRPTRESCRAVADRYLATITDGSRELIERLRAAGWRPVILSGGFAPLIEPLARELGVEHVEAVPLHFDETGRYLGYGEDYPTTRNGGKPEVIRQWKRALLPRKTLMLGDGNSDLEAGAECDLVVGYGGVIARDRVRDQADYWIESLRNFPFHELTESPSPGKTGETA